MDYARQIGELINLVISDPFDGRLVRHIVDTVITICHTYQAPSVKMHACQLGEIRFGNVNVERLTLANERTTIGRHFDDRFLRYLPYSPIDLLQIIWNCIDFLQMMC